MEAEWELVVEVLAAKAAEAKDQVSISARGEHRAWLPKEPPLVPHLGRELLPRPSTPLLLVTCQLRPARPQTRLLG